MDDDFVRDRRGVSSASGRIFVILNIAFKPQKIGQIKSDDPSGTLVLV
jgi:hypothetical protein